MEQSEINLNDISEELLIVNKKTIEALFKLDDALECVALYMFYYKTAKWQKTNQIKATDEYAKKVLKIGKSKLIKAKKTLKENGLIDIVQKRENNKISGWYIKVSYIVQKRDIKDVKVLVQEDLSKKSQNEQVPECTSSFQNTNAYKINNKYLNNKNINTVQELIDYVLNIENRKTNKNNYGTYGNVRFTKEQYEKLVNEFPKDYEERIKTLDEYIQMRGDKYKDHLATIRNWARKDKPKQSSIYDNKECYDINGKLVEEYHSRIELPY